MFFFGIFGILDSEKRLKEFQNIICTCGSYSRAVLFMRYSYFHIFFIPIFKWNKRYYVTARCCGKMFAVPDDYVNELMKSNNIDFSKLHAINNNGSYEKRCSNCGMTVDNEFEYCPYCGKKL